MNGTACNDRFALLSDIDSSIGIGIERIGAEFEETNAQLVAIKKRLDALEARNAEIDELQHEAIARQ